MSDDELRTMVVKATSLGDHIIAYLAAEALRLRAKEAAAVKLAEAVKHYRDFVLDHTGSGEVVPVITEPSSRLTLALAAWESAK